MKISILPTTKLGKWAIWLFVTWFGITAFVTAYGPHIVSIRFIMAPALFCGFASGIVGLISWFKKERGLLVIVPSVLGTLTILFVLGEIFFPHA